MGFTQKELVFLFLICSANSVYGTAKAADGTCPSSANISCKPGILLPVWTPISDISVSLRVVRALVYFLCLMYCFLGVSIIADRFMSAIEVITSQEKEVQITTKTGELRVVSVRIWNQTVSNLTLMALGSSAPEILLSVIEICGTNFMAGELGPGTIVGSAAFNLFVIIGICIAVIPNGEVRRIKHLGVFIVTAVWSIFAYLWLYCIIAITSKGVVEFWEAFLTFLFFPLTVLSAYIADTKLFQKKFLKKKYKARRKGAYSLPLFDGQEENGKNTEIDASLSLSNSESIESEYERTRIKYIEAIKNLRKKNPNIDPTLLEELAQTEVLNSGPKSRALYRIQATRHLTGGSNILLQSKVARKLSITNPEVSEPFGPEIQQFSFDQGHYTVMENVGKFYVTVSRKGGDLSNEVTIDYATEDGTAVAGEDYERAIGTLIFRPNQVRKQISITIIDDDVFEEDEHFNIRLSNLQVVQSREPNPDCRIVDPSVASVMVLDDDHCGVFHFKSDSVNINESCEVAEFTVIRSAGARGIVRIPYKTIDGTAKGNGVDYMDASGYLEFKNDQTEEVIKVKIVDDNDYEKNEYFFIELGDPIFVDNAGLLDSRSVFAFVARMISSGAEGSSKPTMQKIPVNEIQLPSDPDEAEQLLENEGLDTGKPRLGEFARLQVKITESVELKGTVDRLVKHGKWALMVGTSSWKEQFEDAISVKGGSDEDLEELAENEVKAPSFMDYLMHFLTVFWKVLFAFVPPTDYGKGWLCFVVSIIMIGFLTAIIGDLASSFGCTVGLTDAVTATTFVALGTSLPDTFASKVAAVGDKYADSCVCNVTGSNAVNVFLGIGVAWTIATIFHWSRGSTFVVPAGSLGFSVTVFCIFALVAMALLLVRRRPALGGGELGGSPAAVKWISSGVFIALWAAYVLLTSTENYCYIEGF